VSKLSPVLAAALILGGAATAMAALSPGDAWAADPSLQT